MQEGILDQEEGVQQSGKENHLQRVEEAPATWLEEGAIEAESTASTAAC